MQRARSRGALSDVDVVVMAAAVADFGPKASSDKGDELRMW